MPMPGSICVDTNSGENALYSALVDKYDAQTVTRQRQRCHRPLSTKLSEI